MVATATTNGKRLVPTTQVEQPKTTIQEVDLFDRVNAVVKKKYKISLKRRDEQDAELVFYAVGELVGNNLSSQVDNFDWKDYKNWFQKTFGEMSNENLVRLATEAFDIKSKEDLLEINITRKA